MKRKFKFLAIAALAVASLSAFKLKNKTAAGFDLYYGWHYNAIDEQCEQVVFDGSHVPCATNYFGPVCKINNQYAYATEWECYSNIQTQILRKQY